MGGRELSFFGGWGSIIQSSLSNNPVISLILKSCWEVGKFIVGNIHS